MDSNTFMLRRRAMMAQAGKDPALYRNLWKGTKLFDLSKPFWLRRMNASPIRRASVFSPGFYKQSFEDTRDDWGFIQAQDASLEEGKRYAVSFILDVLYVSDLAGVYLVSPSGTFDWIVRCDGEEVFDEKEGFGYFRLTGRNVLVEAMFTVDSYGAQNEFELGVVGLNLHTYDSITSFSIEKIQLEKGDVATEWSPHIDDPEE